MMIYGDISEEERKELIKKLAEMLMEISHEMAVEDMGGSGSLTVALERSSVEDSV